MKNASRPDAARVPRTVAGNSESATRPGDGVRRALAVGGPGGSLRDLTRAREAAKKDQLRARHRLGKFFLGKGPSPYDNSGAELIDVYWCPMGEDCLSADNEA